MSSIQCCNSTSVTLSQPTSLEWPFDIVGERRTMHRTRDNSNEGISRASQQLSGCRECAIPSEPLTFYSPIPEIKECKHKFYPRLKGPRITCNFQDQDNSRYLCTITLNLSHLMPKRMPVKRQPRKYYNYLNLTMYIFFIERFQLAVRRQSFHSHDVGQPLVVIYNQENRVFNSLGLDEKVNPLPFSMSRYGEAHKHENLRGAGDARPTALQIIEDEGLIGKLSDKVFLVTGVSSGIGIETLRALHATGTHVYGTVRNVAKGQKVVNEILAEKREGGGEIDLIELELDSFESVRKGAQDFLSKSGGKLNVIVANARVTHTPYGKTKDGFETQFGTNHLGHFLLFQLLKDALLASATPEFPSRYVSVTSLGHSFGSVKFDDYNFDKTEYDGWVGYGQSKTANIWMANAIERHYGSQHLHATSVHPGGIMEGSGLGKYLPIEKAGMFLTPEALRTYKSAAQGAATQVWAAVGKEWANKGGKYLSSCTEQISWEEKAKEEGMFYMANDGYHPWAYDEAGEERLWKESFGMVGLEEKA
ncbi:hypothetical protein BKA70DRAFT_1222394 [Coprinopsis sp. MPI-PUGE-AT-0042]|nr:hypothetical protein BKA70DRAFT_1222394 [Coprinopsis sp. MPI-PUGE-AT-0042]